MKTANSLVGIVSLCTALVAQTAMAATGYTVQAAGKDSAHQFDAKALSQAQAEGLLGSCHATVGASFFSNWIGALALPAPFDFPPSATSFGLNLALKWCPPVLEVPEKRGITPEGMACGVNLKVDTSAEGRVNHIMYTPVHGPTQWGELGEVGVDHMNSSVVVNLRHHTGEQTEDGVYLPIGEHEFTYRGDTRISVVDGVFVYVPNLPSGTRWPWAVDLFYDLAQEASLITAGQLVDDEPHNVWQDSTQQIIVRDEVPPALNLSQGSITLEANAFGGATRFFYQPQIDALITASDHCDRPIEITFDKNYFPVNETTELLITVWDDGPNFFGERNSTAAFLSVTVEDTFPPVLSIPDNHVVETIGSAEIVLGNADVFDFVDDAPTVEHDALLQTGVIGLGGGEFLFPPGLTTVTWTATDASANSSQGTQSVNVKAVGTNLPPVTCLELPPCQQDVAALTEEVTDIVLNGFDADLDPLNFRITMNPEHGTLVSPLLPFFVEDYRQPVGEAPQGEDYRCQQGRPSNEFAWPHSMAVTKEGFTYILDVGSDLPPGTENDPEACGNEVFKNWPNHRLHKLAPDGSYLTSVLLPQVGGYDFGGTLSINEDTGTLVYATGPDLRAFLLIDLEAMAVVETINMPDYNSAWKAILTEDDILIWITGREEIFFHDLRESREVTNANEVARPNPYPIGEFNTDIVRDAEGNLYVKAGFGPIFKYAPYTFDENGDFVLGELIGWLGACASGSGCDVANQRSRGYSCTDATCTHDFPGFNEYVPGRVTGTALALDPLDNLYVGGSHVQRFTPTGLFAGIAYPDCPTNERCFVFGDFGGAPSLFVNEHHLYTVDPDFELFHVFQTSVFTPIDETSVGIKYLSTWGFQGTDTIAYITSDGLDDSLPGTVAVNVTRQYRAPVAYRDRRQDITEDVKTILQLDGYDPDGPIDTLSIDIVDPPEHGRVVFQQNAWRYTSDSHYNGADGLVFRMFDGLEYSEPEWFEINVIGVNDPPVPDMDESIVAGAGYRLDLNATFTDADPIDLHRVDVDWGDGTVDPEGVILDDGTTTGPVLSEATGQMGSVIMDHAYSTAGVYPLSVCITDNTLQVGDDKVPTESSLAACVNRTVTVSTMVDLEPQTTLLDPMVNIGEFEYQVRAYNRPPELGGGESGETVQLTHDARGVNIVSIDDSVPGSVAGSCTFTAKTIDCDIPSIATNTYFAVDVVATDLPSTRENSKFEFGTHVEGVVNDPNPNNTLKQTIHLVPPADYLVTELSGGSDAAPDGECADVETGRCSLRAALQEISADFSGTPQTIQLSRGVYSLMWEDGPQTRGQYIGGSTVIRGLSPDDTVLLGGEGGFGISVADTRLEMYDLSIEGAQQFGAIEGGFFSSILLDGVRLQGNEGTFGVIGMLLGDLEINNSSIINNSATNGGSLIRNDSSIVTMNNVSITDNLADDALLEHTSSDFEPATTTLNHVTVAHNNVSVVFRSETDAITLGNSIVSGNISATTIECATIESGTGDAVSLGGNILGGDTGCLDLLGSDSNNDSPMLDALKEFRPGLYGRIPLMTSQAVEFALTGTCLERDMIGRKRPFDGDNNANPLCDAGALEYMPELIFSSSIE